MGINRIYLCSAQQDIK